MVSLKTPRRRWARLGMLSALLISAISVGAYFTFEYGLMESDSCELIEMREAVSDGREIEWVDGQVA